MNVYEPNSIALKCIQESLMVDREEMKYYNYCWKFCHLSDGNRLEKSYKDIEKLEI